MQQADDSGGSTRETVVVAVVVGFGDRFTMEKELDALPLAFFKLSSVAFSRAPSLKLPKVSSKRLPD